MQITLFFITLFTFPTQTVLAAPPGCLLSALSTQPNPGDMSSVCGSNALKVQSSIASGCDSSNVSAAQSAFIATCSSYGVKVASYTATATATATATGTGSRTGSTGTITGAATSSKSGSSAGATSSAGAAQPKMGGYAAAAIALVGAVAAL